MDHPENNGRPLVRSQFYLSCESSKRVQTGEPIPALDRQVEHLR